MNRSDSIYVAGHRGMVGSAIVRALEKAGFENIITAGRDTVDLTSQQTVDEFFKQRRPDYVFLAAAKVGGIHANSTYPADFMRENLQIQTNVIDAAYRNDCRKLVFLGSSCIYPRDAEQPMSENALLSGPLEKTNEWYAVAKISGILMCQAYRRQYGFNAISLMPTNLYGVGDNYHLENSHVIPALLRKFHAAVDNGDDTVEVWGTGRAQREFLDVDDLADASLFLMERYDDEDIVNVGTGIDLSIADLAELVKRVTGFEGEVKFDSSMPDGTPRKLLNVDRLHALGWQHSIELEDGLRTSYEWFKNNQDSFRSS